MGRRPKLSHGELVRKPTEKEEEVAQAWIKHNKDYGAAAAELGMTTSNFNVYLDKAPVLRRVAELQAEITAKVPVTRLDILAKMEEIQKWSWERAQESEDMKEATPLAKLALSATMEMGKCIGVDFYKPSMLEESSHDMAEMIDACEAAYKRVLDNRRQIEAAHDKETFRRQRLEEKWGVEFYDEDEANRVGSRSEPVGVGDDCSVDVGGDSVGEPIEDGVVLVQNAKGQWVPEGEEDE